MAWNKRETKSLQSSASEKAYPTIGPGAPISINPSIAGRPYQDGWNIERAYSEGFQKVTWVQRCIDIIASNQASLPAVLREGNDPQGKIVTGDIDLLNLLNTKANIGENSFAFRYRVSSQLLMSTRGVFIEKIMSRSGRLIGLNLLPPQITAPIPDPKTFVSGYQVDLPNGGKIVIPPEKVLWLRKPHPLDPYLSLTPMESAGIAIEIENLAKMYNRNYLMNDGRPGLLLNVRGEIDVDDRAELESRFRGNIKSAGKTTVMSSDDGIDVIDTSASPRDAAYVQMRDITKDEILAAFGVPESALGNASGRTFSNASEELRVFWLETMGPHLQMIARGLDELDDTHYVDFDTSKVPILVVMKHERDKFHMDELSAGTISVNEYRVKTGQEECESDLADSLLMNPNLTPIANTKKPFKQEETPTPDVPVNVPGAAVQPAPLDEAVQQTTEPGPIIEAALRVAKMQFKAENDATNAQSVDRWTELMDMTLDRLFERQKRVITEKASGPKATKAPSAASIFNMEVWNKQLDEDIRPIIRTIMTEASSDTLTQANAESSVALDESIEQSVEDQMARLQKVNETTFEEIGLAVTASLAASSEEERSLLLRAAIVAIFVKLLSKRKRAIAESETYAAWNAGVFLASSSVGPKAVKTWVSRRDAQVRSAHVELDGQSVPVGEPFRLLDGSVIRFPGDPVAPINLTAGCRCRLRFGGVIES